MCACSLILFHHVRPPCGVCCSACDRVYDDDYDDGGEDDDYDDNDDVSSPVSLPESDQPHVDRTLRGAHCTPHTARQERQSNLLIL